MKAYRFSVSPTKPHPSFLRPWLREVVAQSHFAAYTRVMREFTDEWPGVRFRLTLVDAGARRAA